MMDVGEWSPAQVMCRVCDATENREPASVRRLRQAAALVATVSGIGKKIDVHTDDKELIQWALASGGKHEHFAPHSGRSWAFNTVDIDFDDVRVVLFFNDGVRS